MEKTQNAQQQFCSFLTVSAVRAISIVAVALFFAAGFLADAQPVSAAWTEPAAAPPGGNVAAPLNVSNAPQTKAGTLTLQGGLTTTAVGTRNLTIDSTATDATAAGKITAGVGGTGSQSTVSGTAPSISAGLYGVSSSTGDVGLQIGLLGKAGYDSPTSVGVYGWDGTANGNAASAYAGYFLGRVNVTGSLCFGDGSCQNSWSDVGGESLLEEFPSDNTYLKNTSSNLALGGKGNDAPFFFDVRRGGNEGGLYVEQSVIIGKPQAPGAGDNICTPGEDCSSPNCTGQPAQCGAGKICARDGRNACVDGVPPPAPTNFRIDGVTTNNAVPLAWNEVTDESGIGGYQLYRCTGSPDCTMVFLRSLAQNTSQYTDPGLSASTNYYYEITAVDGEENESSHSSRLKATTQSGPDITKPTTPGTPTVNGEAGSYSVPLTWTASTDAESGISHYYVNRCSRFFGSNCSSFQRVADTGTLTTYTDTTVVGNTKYQYYVTAENGAGLLSDDSGKLTLTTPTDTTPPNPPSNLHTVGTIYANAVSLAWNASSSTDVVSYNLYRCTGATGSCATLLQNVENVLTYRDITTTANTQYTYDVAAVDYAFNVSAHATLQVLTTGSYDDVTPPNMPGNLRLNGEVLSNAVPLAWNASVDNFGGSGLKGYKVYRCTGVLCTPTLRGDNGLATTFTDTQVTEANKYVYQVSAYDNAGNEGERSADLAVETPSREPPLDISLQSTPLKHLAQKVTAPIIKGVRPLARLLTSIAPKVDVGKLNIPAATAAGTGPDTRLTIYNADASSIQFGGTAAAPQGSYVIASSDLYLRPKNVAQADGIKLSNDGAKALLDAYKLCLSGACITRWDEAGGGGGGGIGTINVTAPLTGGGSGETVNIGFSAPLAINFGGTSNTTYNTNKFLIYDGTKIVSSAYDNTSFLTTENDTLQTVTDRGRTTTNFLGIGASGAFGGGADPAAPIDIRSAGEQARIGWSKDAYLSILTNASGLATLDAVSNVGSPSFLLKDPVGIGLSGGPTTSLQVQAPAQKTATGTVRTRTDGDARKVVGTNTTFSADVKKGDTITIGTDTKTVIVVNSDTELHTDTDIVGTYTGVPMTVKPRGFELDTNGSAVAFTLSGQGYPCILGSSCIRDWTDLIVNTASGTPFSNLATSGQPADFHINGSGTIGTALTVERGPVTVTGGTGLTTPLVAAGSSTTPFNDNTTIAAYNKTNDASTPYHAVAAYKGFSSQTTRGSALYGELVGGTTCAAGATCAAVLGVNNALAGTTYAGYFQGELAAQPLGFDTVFLETSGTNWTDYTAEANSTGGTPFIMFGNTTPGDSHLLVGASRPFNAIAFFLARRALSTFTIAAEYSTGTTGSWNSLTMTDGTANMTRDGAVTFSPPGNWLPQSENGSPGRYWVRFRIVTCTNCNRPYLNTAVPQQSATRASVLAASGDAASPALFVGSYRRVGVGTASPNESLEVAGGLRTYGANEITNYLSAQLNIGDTSLKLANSTADWPQTGTVIIDDEVITYSGTSMLGSEYGLTNLGRGAYGTTAAQHLANAKVDNYLFSALVKSNTGQPIPRFTVSGAGNVRVYNQFFLGTATADPATGTNGQMYFLSNGLDHRFRCYQDGWKDCIGTGGGGTVTQINQGDGLTLSPNPITVTGTVGLNASQITSCTNGTTSKLYWDNTNKRLVCGTDQDGGGSGWSLTGNASTNPPTNFLGTTDAKDLVVKTSGAERLRVLSGGNVGIGIANPNRKFVVKGDDAVLGLVGTDETYQWDLVNNPSWGPGSLHIWERKQDGARLSILSGGNVGVGTSSPGDKLTVDVETLTDSGATITGSGNDIGLRLTNTGTNGLDWFLDATGGTSGYGAGNLAFAQFGTSPAMLIKSTNRVGINVASSSIVNRLEIAESGSGVRSIERLQNTITAAVNSGAQLVFAANRTDGITNTMTNVAGIAGIITDTGNTTYKGALAFYTANVAAPAERVRIDYAGNVGIGTNAPGALLSVGSTNNFQVNASGDIVKIESISYDWPGSQGSANTVLTNNGSGGLSWANANTSIMGTARYFARFDDDGIGLVNSRLYDVAGNSAAIAAQDGGGFEGGELRWDGSGSDPSFTFDNYDGYLRLMMGATTKLTVQQSGTVRIEGISGAGSTLSIGGNGDIGIDAPGTSNGRFVVKDGGNVGIGNNDPISPLTVYSYSTPFSGNASSIAAYNSSTNAYNAVAGEKSGASAAGSGVYGELRTGMTCGNNQTCAGVYGTASNIAPGSGGRVAGVYGYASNASSYAGYFQGKVNIAGDLNFTGVLTANGQPPVIIKRFADLAAEADIDTGISSVYNCTVGGFESDFDIEENNNHQRRIWTYVSGATWRLAIGYQEQGKFFRPDVDVLCVHGNISQWQGSARELNSP